MLPPLGRPSSSPVTPPHDARHKSITAVEATAGELVVRIMFKNLPLASVGNEPGKSQKLTGPTLNGRSRLAF
jgi:hypothetical protein